ncbi:type II secretion system inner membrane protein GspF [Teredinibacter haidensis]|uniref:type II secretion system inner membrane protein GspF n=1 Tax=Teredinibacter haidensis TaxID=2731755 RepID=UPI0009488DF4|nr:type II secretion system inner membrane protein GspF [Teredinibacter haidensis]
MGAYSYQALDVKGKKVKGVLEGDSERHVRTQLRAKQLKPLNVKTTRERVRGSKESKLSFSFGRPHMGYRDVSLVTRQLASLIQSGLPLDEVLASTAKQSRKPAAKTIILQVRSRVMEGLSLAQALAEMPKVFDNLYRAMVRAGESSGYLGPVLEQLADYTERTQEAKQKLKMAMVYPVIMLLVSITVVTLMMVKVVPQLVGMFERNKQDLPAVTEFLIGASNFLVNYGVFVLIAIVAAIVAFNSLIKEEGRKRKWHAIVLRLPVAGNLVLQAESARYASTLGLLANSGVPLLEALRIAAQVLSNKQLQRASAEVAVMVQEGSSLNKALDSVGVFPPLLVQMAASGEANGRLAEQLEHAARNQERELEFTVNTALGLMEPLMVLLMGGMVTFIVLAILLPIFQMNQLIH